MKDTKILIAYCGQHDDGQNSENANSLCNGNSACLAKFVLHLLLAAHLQASTYEIKGDMSYTENGVFAQAPGAQTKFQRGPRPMLIDPLDPSEAAASTTLILCYPNRAGTAPLEVFAFLERYDWRGKTIIPLCNHEGCYMGHSEDDIQKSAPYSKLQVGLAINGKKSVTITEQTEATIRSYLNKLGLLPIA